MAKIHHPNLKLKEAVKFVVECAASHSITPKFLGAQLQEFCSDHRERRKSIKAWARRKRPAIQHLVKDPRGYRSGGHINLVCLFLLAAGVATKLQPPGSARVARAGEFIRKFSKAHRMLVKALEKMGDENAHQISAWFGNFILA